MQINQFSYKHFYFEGPLLNYRLPTCYATNQNQPTSKNLLSVGFIVIFPYSLKGFESFPFQYDVRTVDTTHIRNLDVHFILHLHYFTHKMIIMFQADLFMGSIFKYRLHTTVNNLEVFSEIFYNHWGTIVLLNKYYTTITLQCESILIGRFNQN